MTTASTQTRKRGKLSLEDEKYIRENLKLQSVAEIAEALNRNEEPILKFMEKNKLIQGGEVSDYETIKKRLKGEYFYKSIESQLEDDEQDYFISGWVELIQQFNEDVTHTEKQQIKQFLLLEISKNRCGFNKKKENKNVLYYEKLIEDEMKLGSAKNDANIMAWTQQLSMAKLSLQAHATEFDKYNKASQDILKDLKGTRDQRYKNVEAGHTTFNSIIKQLAEEDNRIQQGKELELLRLAAEKKKNELYEYHEFLDGVVEPPIFNTESVKKLREKDNEKE